MNSRAVPAETDVFVIGGGPAGLAAALAARQSGFEVIVADRAPPSIDKVCAEGLMPDGVAALRGIGVELGPEHGAPSAAYDFWKMSSKPRRLFQKIRISAWAFAELCCTGSSWNARKMPAS